MSEDREASAGSPVEQAEVTDTQVLAAVERAADVPAPEGGAEPVASERPVIAETSEPPSAAKVETAEEIFAAHTPRSTSGSNSQLETASASVEEPAAAVAIEGDASSATATTSAPIAGTVSTTDTAATGPALEEKLAPERDGEIRISADHPMAALYMQSPMPPEVKGNRGAGVLIALLSTVAFALVYVGVLALWLAPNYPPSRFLDDGLLPLVLNWGPAAAAVGFFVGFAILVLIVGRAGWWAYVLGGFLVAVFTWAVALLGFALSVRFDGGSVMLHPYSLAVDFGLFFPVLAAGLVAREITVWFGAWIGSRGRKTKRQNAEAIAEYERALAEARSK